MQFYTKGEDGEFAEVTQEQLENEFKPRYERFKKTETPKIRSELEESVRNELTPKLTEELRTTIESEFKPKLDEAESKIQKLDIQVRQKTIAAEYGFKKELESFLGDGTDDDMRAKADILKNNNPAIVTTPDKKTITTGTQKGFVVKVD